MGGLIAAAIGGSSALSAGSSLIGSGKSSSASKQAANESLIGTQMSIANEDNMFNVAQSNLSPYNYWGQAALPAMWQNAAGSQVAQPYINQAQNYLTQAAGMDPSKVLTEAGLQQTPGYQFTQQQGLQATQAAAAARGLGVSGASLKGAATYATGLADATYSNRFSEAQQSWSDVMNQGQQSLNLGSQALSQQQQGYDQWKNIASLGENAAAMTGQAATSTAGQTSQAISSGTGQYGNYLTQSGQAQAAGTSGVGNALTSGVNNYLSYSTLQQLLGGTGGTSGFQSANTSPAASQGFSNAGYYTSDQVPIGGY